MAERRMFAKTIIDSDAFLDMPLSTQALYFHLSMRADDEGFVNNPKKIARMIGADDDSLRILLSKQYLIPFESGVVVIKHWKIHNYIRGDRLTETSYKQEKSMLSIDENGAYSILDDIKEIQALDSGDKRKLAYQNSTLPYSFTYKIKRAFEGKTCPMCGCKMSSLSKRTMPTIQHNKPISDGGEHELHNISVICLSCNTSIQNQETGELNNSEVIEMWDRIVYADKHKIKWFFDLSLLEDVYKQEMSDKCQTSDGQVTDKCLTQVRLGKVRKGKNNINADSKSAYESEFDTIWKLYPRKEGKSTAYKAYVKARKDGETKESILDGLNRYLTQIKAEGTPAKFIKHGSTWFNQRCWHDEYRNELDEINENRSDYLKILKIEDNEYGGETRYYADGYVRVYDGYDMMVKEIKPK